MNTAFEICASIAICMSAGYIAATLTALSANVYRVHLDLEEIARETRKTRIAMESRR